MPLNPTTAAVQLANDANSLAQEMYALQGKLVEILNRSQLQATDATWKTFPTCANFGPGGASVSPDAQPNNAHPMDVNQIPGLTQAASEAQYAALLGLFQTFAALGTPQNQAVVAPFLV